MTTPELEIVWDGGSLNLMGENDTPYGEVTIDALTDGTEWGKPESIRRALLSAMSDGSTSALERHDNRMPVVKLRLTAADSAALAGGEMPLHMLSTKQRPELRWTPPNDFAAPAAFILTESDLTHQMDDLAENRCVRYYTLSMKALPFALSVDPVVIEALPPFVAAPSVLDACTSTTGWASVSGSATFAAVSGSIEISSLWNGGLGTVSALTKTLARAKRYIAIESELVNGQHFGSGGTLAASFRTSGGWQIAPLVGAEGRWSFFDLPHALGSVLESRFTFYYPGKPGATKILARIMTIAESDAPSATAGRQSLRVISTPGSARADGSLLVESRDAATDGTTGTVLGQIIAYTGPQYDPRLSVGRIDTPTVDSVALSGQKVTKTGGTFIFDRRANSFVSGSHSMWLHALGTNGQVVAWTVTVRVIGSVYTGPSDSLRTVATLTSSSTLVGTGYNLINLGTLDLPGFGVATTSDLNLRFEIGATGTVTLDEALVFNRTLGSLTVIDARNTLSLKAGAAGWEPIAGATRVWLDAPSIEGPARISAGRVSNSLAVPASLSSELLAWDGVHMLTPDATYLYVGTTGVADPKVTGEFRPAWHTHPAA